MNEPSFSQFAKQEFSIASAEIRKFAPQESLLRFYRRHDAAISNAVASAAIKPACRAGCSYCCYFKVEVRAVEVLAIHQFVINRFKPEQIRQVVAQATSNVEQAKHLSHAEHLATNQRCPFLLEDQCSVYPVRPSACRHFHASNVQLCKDSYEQPTNLGTPDSYINELLEAGDGTIEGFYVATEGAGLDPRVYDLNSAFIEAMQNPKAAKRLKAGKKTFLSARVVDVPDQDVE